MQKIVSPQFWADWPYNALPPPLGTIWKEFHSVMVRRVNLQRLYATHIMILLGKVMYLAQLS